jgi:hypothetical protein
VYRVTTDEFERYRQRLTEHGVADVPTADQAWLAYRRQAMHGLVFWLFTIGAGPLQPDMQPRDICLANLERMGQAVTDLATLDSYRPEQRPRTARSEQAF